MCVDSYIETFVWHTGKPGTHTTQPGTHGLPCTHTGHQARHTAGGRVSRLNNSLTHPLQSDLSSVRPTTPAPPPLLGSSRHGRPSTQPAPPHLPPLPRPHTPVTCGRRDAAARQPQVVAAATASTHTHTHTHTSSSSSLGLYRSLFPPFLLFLFLVIPIPCSSFVLIYLSSLVGLYGTIF